MNIFEKKGTHELQHLRAADLGQGGRQRLHGSLSTPDLALGEKHDTKALVGTFPLQLLFGARC